MDHRRLIRITRRQKGIFNHRQAIECGYSAYQVRRRLEEGQWQRVVGSSYALAGLRITPSLRDRAAALSFRAPCSPRRRLPGRGASTLPTSARSSTSGRMVAAASTASVAIHATPDQHDVSLFDGMPTTSLACAVVEMLATITGACRTDIARPLTPEGLARPLTSCLAGSPQGWAAQVAGAWCGLLQQVGGGERSVPERLLTRALRAARISGWRSNVVIRDADGVIGIGDVVFDGVQLVLEVDGWPSIRRRIDSNATAAPEPSRRGRLDRAPLHLARPHHPPRSRDRRDPSRARRASRTGAGA